jgi:RIO kinase 1
MKAPKRLQPLVEDGLIDEVISRLMSGKEADIYVVRCHETIRCAKVYKDAVKRSFKNAAQYQEGRKVRSSRRARAMAKSTNFGRKEQEAIWQNAEVDALYRLASAGVRVPQPYDCIDGVLIMELVTDENGDVASRLNDVIMDKEQAVEDHALIMHYINLMLCEGIIHGDLSEFNVLVNEEGPVIIDLPQAVNAAANNQAKSMLARDVNNMTRYYGQFAPELLKTRYADELWALYEEGSLKPDTQLTGRFKEDNKKADVDGVILEIRAAFEAEQERLARIHAANE